MSLFTALWAAHVLSCRLRRLAIHTLCFHTFPHFPPPQDPSLSYGQVVSRADATTHTLFGILGVIVVLAVLLLGGRPAV